MALDSRGNALFLILIAVALFAALSYAVTQSGRGGGNTDRETTEIQAAQMVQYAGSIQYAVQKLKLFGCAEDEISFLYDTNNDGSVLTDGSDEFYNPNTTSTACMIFDQDGAGVTPMDIPNGLLDDPTGYYYFSGAGEYLGHGTSEDDLVLVGIKITERACIAINNKVGISGLPAENPPNESLTFEGSYGGSARVVGDSGAATELVGEPTGCYFNTEDSWYVFYQLLLAR